MRDLCENWRLWTSLSVLDTLMLVSYGPFHTQSMLMMPVTVGNRLTEVPSLAMLPSRYGFAVRICAWDLIILLLPFLSFVTRDYHHAPVAVKFVVLLKSSLNVCKYFSITARAASASAIDTLDLLILLQLRARDTTYACGIEVRLFRLYAP